MGLGEKINYYRKNKGISQENLAEILGVSRQSVSLWENNQTIPSMDKLFQLSRVLDISMDELVDRRKTKFDTDSKPLASATSSFDKDMIDETLKVSLKKFRISSIIFTILSIYLLVIFIVDGESQTDAFVFIPILLLIIIAIRYFRFTSKVKGDAYKGIEIDPDKVYFFDFYTDYVNISISSSKSESKIQIKYTDFNQVFETDNYYMLVYLNRYYSIKKVDIKGDEVFLKSILKYKMKKYQSIVEKIENKDITIPLKKISKIKLISTISFVLTIFTLPLALIIWALYSFSNDSYSSFAAFKDVWVFLLVLPLPIFSIMIGLYANKHGLKRTKNIVIGVIMSVLLVIYSSISILAGLMTNHDYQYLDDMETIINFEFPDTGNITTQMQNASSEEYIFISESDVLFTDNEEIIAFEHAITSSELWTDSISTQNIGMLSISATFQKDNYDYFMIFNVDLQTYNEIPVSSGLYHLIFFAYNSDNNTMKIMEYEIYLDIE